MEPSGYDAFWSYTHEDNERSGNRVLNLAAALKNEFALCTADELGLFIDRRNLEWGDAWRERVDSAVADVPFFIPIITPKYVRSQECRREFIAFSSSAKSRGLDKLLLPILYIPVPGLDENSDDELLALIARTQYVDWTALRLLAPEDPRVLQGLNDLALKLMSLVASVVVLAKEEETKTPAENDTDLAEVVEAIANRLEPWMESVDFDKIAGATWRATLDERLARVRRLQRSTSGNSAIFSTFVQLGTDLLPIALDRLAKAKNYSRLTIELDPLVNTAIRLIRLHREGSSELDSLRDGINEAYLNIEPIDPDDSGFSLPEGLVDMNKHLRQTNDALSDSSAFVQEGNAIVLGWREKLIDLDGPAILQLAR